MASILFASVSCGLFSQTSPALKHEYATYKKLALLVEGSVKKDFLLLDVRTTEEYAEGHIPGAVNIPYDELKAGNPEFSKDKLVIVYCRSGRRSAIAVDALVQLGFKDIADFGAVSKWKGKLVTGSKSR